MKRPRPLARLLCLVAFVCLLGVLGQACVSATDKPERVRATVAPAGAPSPSPAPAPSGVSEPAAAAGQGDAEKEDVDVWPRVLEGRKYDAEIHAPQLESWDGARLTAMNALVVVEKGSGKRHFGTIRYNARTRVDKESRMVAIDTIRIDRVVFPSAPAEESRIIGFLQPKFDTVVRIVSLDRLEAAVAAIEMRKKSPSLQVRNDPPVIVFAETPTLIVSIDGPPIWRPVDGTTYQRLFNTRPLVLKDAGGRHYLHLFDGWLESPALDGPWAVAKAKPAGLDAAQKAAMSRQPADLLEGGGDDKSEVDENGKPIERPTLARGPVPAIRIATRPTEVVMFDGSPKWAQIPGIGLEYVENTGGHVFRREAGGYFVLLSGRWFTAPSLDGPWSFVPQSQLAADFRAIPDDSAKENVKASVAGTPQAEEAEIANSIPETAEVDREAEFTATYDGEPKWKAIEGTTLVYAENSPTPVLRAGSGHYAVFNGVWFTAPAATGPWKVATQVPPEIYTIPTSSPIHYVTYVKIYDSDKETVTVGYTPGYYGSVVADEVVVYGTGYAYDPWVGGSWYGYPATYGYGCGGAYTPWNGWGWTCGLSWGWGYWGGWYGPYYPPYWGPYWGYGWYGGVAIGAGGGWAAWGPGGWAGSTGNIYQNWGNRSSVSRYSGGFNAWTGNAWRGQVGASYNSRTGRLSAGQRGAVANVYTGEYAYGGRGITRSGSGNVVGGGRVTMGDADTGREVTAGRVGGYNPNTGQSGSAGWVRGESGGVARVGDDYYAGKDGNVYRREGQGEWSQVGAGGEPKRVTDTSRTRDLSRQSSARDYGSQRYQSHRSTSPSYRGGGYRGGGMRGGGGRRR